MLGGCAVLSNWKLGGSGVKQHRNLVRQIRAALADLPVEERGALIRDSASAVRGASSEAIRSLFLVNGGACIALLGFLGAAIQHDTKAELARALSLPLTTFAIGVFFCASTHVLRYFSTAHAAQPTKAVSLSKAQSYEKAAIGSGLLALAAFLIGVTLVSGVLNDQLLPNPPLQADQPSADR